MFLTYILTVLLFTYRDGHALPVYCTATQPPRTLFGIAWGCLLTVFICAWTSVHPNVPPKGRMGGLLARIKLMFWTIVAPELVLAWAVRQWFAAREIKEIHNQHMENRPLTQWTMAHGHFLVMGGFKLVSNKIHQLKEPAQPGWMSTSADWEPFDRFKEVLDDPNYILPAITHAEIQDRSKGDGLSKLLAILQTSWFILQCVARGFQGLALELVTLAMASLNAITFAFWWSKPLGVQEPVNVYVTVQAGVAAEKVSQDEDVEGDDVYYTTREVIDETRGELRHLVDFIFNPGSDYHFSRKDFYGGLRMYLLRLPIFPLFVLTYPVFLLFPLGILFLLWLVKTDKVENAQDDDTVATRVVLALRKLRYNLTHSIRQYFGRRGRRGPLRSIVSYNYDDFLMDWFFIIPAYFLLLLLLLLLLSPLFAIFFIASFTFTAAFEIVTTNKVRPSAAHVPAFYAPRTKSDRYSRMIVFAIFGAIFGGIHCIAWNFIFPTHSERSLWRYTSLVLTAIPLAAAPIDCILENVTRVGKKLRLLLGIFMTALLFLYVPARISLIAQALALLRDQPAAAYIPINWTKYIPHLFS